MPRALALLNSCSVDSGARELPKTIQFAMHVHDVIVMLPEAVFAWKTLTFV